MKSTLFTAFSLALLAATAGAQQRFQQPALLIKSPTDFEQVWISAADKTQIRYYKTENGVDSELLRWSSIPAIWLMEPAEYTEAMELYQGRKYDEAAAKFAKVREDYIKLQNLPDNHSSLAAFYQMECLRKQLKLEELMEVEKKFLPVDRESLSREHQVRQLDFNTTLWDAAQNKSWERLELICKEQLGTRMPGYQRAQLGYCLGLALEGLNKPIPAINAYNIAMTADTGASEVLTAKAALNSLRLYKADEDVKLAIKLAGTPDEDPDSSGRLRLEEAASLAKLFQITLGDGAPLPSEYKDLLKFLSTVDVDAPKEEPKAPEKAPGKADDKGAEKPDPK